PPSSEASDHHIFERPNTGAKKGGGQTNAVSLTGLGEWLFSSAGRLRKKPFTQARQTHCVRLTTPFFRPCIWSL
ncbi:hypothetical protein, partial [Providencia huashanensis]|uniref:hypothetical protein n=1 Tax=Providencia huashanensis TaxID=3037798 RepID=UPI002AFE0A1D